MPTCAGEGKQRRGKGGERAGRGRRRGEVRFVVRLVLAHWRLISATARALDVGGLAGGSGARTSSTTTEQTIKTQMKTEISANEKQPAVLNEMDSSGHKHVAH